jgi:hypothetical protein
LKDAFVFFMLYKNDRILLMSCFKILRKIVKILKMPMEPEGIEETITN